MPVGSYRLLALICAFQHEDWRWRDVDMLISVSDCFDIFFFVIDVGANMFVSIAINWFVLGITEQEEEFIYLSPAMIIIWLAEYPRPK